MVRPPQMVPGQPMGGGAGQLGQRGPLLAPGHGQVRFRAAWFHCLRSDSNSNTLFHPAHHGQPPGQFVPQGMRPHPMGQMQVPRPPNDDCSWPGWSNSSQ